MKQLTRDIYRLFESEGFSVNSEKMWAILDTIELWINESEGKQPCVKQS